MNIAREVIDEVISFSNPSVVIILVLLGR
jgi:hypothetical protein